MLRSNSPSQHAIPEFPRDCFVRLFSSASRWARMLRINISFIAENRFPSIKRRTLLGCSHFVQFKVGTQT